MGNVPRETICWPSGNTGRKDNKMKLRTTKGTYVDLSPLQLKLSLYCIARHVQDACKTCPYDSTCTTDYFIPLSETPNGVCIPQNFKNHMITNNYRKLHNLPKKRKGVDYFD